MENYNFFLAVGIVVSGWKFLRDRIVGLGVADHSCACAVCVFPVFYISLRSRRNLNIIYVQSSLFFRLVRFISVRFR